MGSVDHDLKTSVIRIIHSLGAPLKLYFIDLSLKAMK
jgi:hypothetical protein